MSPEIIIEKKATVSLYCNTAVLHLTTNSFNKNTKFKNIEH